MNILILDSCAMIAYLDKENGTEVINDIVKQATRDGRNTKIYMHKINLLEVYYITARKSGEQKANWTMSVIAEMPITIIDGLDDSIFKQAGILKSKHKISLADAVAAAESMARDGALVTADHHEFEAVERSENIRILWFR